MSGMKDTDVKRGRYGSFVLDIRMYLHSPYADFHTPYADFHSQGSKFKVGCPIDVPTFCFYSTRKSMRFSSNYNSPPESGGVPLGEGVCNRIQFFLTV